MHAGNREEREPQHNVEQTRDWLAEATDAPADLTEFEHFTLPGSGDLDVEDAFGEHTIEYWVWDGNRLVPASPNKVARIREIEALARLAWWNQLESRQTPMQASGAILGSRRPFAAVWRITACADRIHRPRQPSRTGEATDHELSRRVSHYASPTEHRPPD